MLHKLGFYHSAASELKKTQPPGIPGLISEVQLRPDIRGIADLCRYGWTSPSGKSSAGKVLPGHPQKRRTPASRT